jgi:KDO2-lipid IV(A) lauroyltransferase
MIKNLFEFLSFKILSILILFIPINLLKNVLTPILTFLAMKTKWQKNVAVNLKIAYPGISEPDINLESRHIWNNFLYFCIEFLYINQFNSSIDKLFNISINNLDKFQNDIQNNKCIFVTSHIGNFEILLLKLSTFVPKLAVVYRKSNNPLMDSVIKNNRSKNDIMFISKGKSGASDLLYALKNNYHIAILCDQKLNEGIDVPFFHDKKAKTTDSVAKIAKKFDYKLIPLYCVRSAENNFVINIESALNLNNDDSIYDITLKINQAITKMILEYKHQWFWMHRRFEKNEYV